MALVASMIAWSNVSTLEAAYTFTNIADTTTPAPSGSFAGFGAVATSGNIVSFLSEFGSGEGVFTGSGGPLTTIIKTGDTAPFGTFSELSPSTSSYPRISGGTVAVYGAYPRPNNTCCHSGIFLGSGGALTAVAKSGDAAPPGGTFNSFSDAPAISGDTVAMLAGYLNSRDTGIFTTSGGPLSTIVKYGDAAPVGIFTQFNDAPAIDDDRVAFSASYGAEGNSPGNGIFTGNGGALTTIVKEGDAAPIGTFIGVVLERLAISGNTVAFHGAYWDGVIVRDGIFTGSGGPVNTIAAEGDPAPIGTFVQFGAPSIAGSTVAFSGIYSDGISLFSGLFVNSGGPVSTVIKAGDQLFGSTLETVSFFQSGLDPDGSGNLSFEYTLMDGRRGVALARVGADPGSSQDNPILPSNPGETPFVFDNVASGLWFDPPLVPSFVYTAQPGTLFSGILDFPTGFSDQFTVAVGGSEIGQFGPGQSVSFAGFAGGGVTQFTVSGINPLVDAQNPIGFPLRIGFTTPRGSFVMSAVPEPSGFLILAIAAVPLGWLRVRAIRNVRTKVTATKTDKGGVG